MIDNKTFIKIHPENDFLENCVIDEEIQKIGTKQKSTNGSCFYIDLDYEEISSDVTIIETEDISIVDELELLKKGN